MSKQLVEPMGRDEVYNRDYITMPGGWEVQTKGKGSSFRVSDATGEHRLLIPPSPYLHETLTKMAREVHAACVAYELAHPEVWLPITEAQCTGAYFVVHAANWSHPGECKFDKRVGFWRDHVGIVSPPPTHYFNSAIRPPEVKE